MISSKLFKRVFIFNWELINRMAAIEWPKLSQWQFPQPQFSLSTATIRLYHILLIINLCYILFNNTYMQLCVIVEQRGTNWVVGNLSEMVSRITLGSTNNSYSDSRDQTYFCTALVGVNTNDSVSWHKDRNRQTIQYTSIH